ncbi:MAG: hypothetical protein EOO01_27315 [Chitinophagaceae bacterium]|nr:MAG: hypothetical protein EOO01_27315 [Chitinophagaceae bacterium]
MVHKLNKRSNTEVSILTSEFVAGSEDLVLKALKRLPVKSLPAWLEYFISREQYEMCAMVVTIQKSAPNTDSEPRPGKL